jgi:hypothetical protein
MAYDPIDRTSVEFNWNEDPDTAKNSKTVQTVTAHFGDLSITKKFDHQTTDEERQAAEVELTERLNRKQAEQ